MESLAYAWYIARAVSVIATVLGVTAIATLFSVASGVAAHLKGRFAGRWLIAGFLLGPLAFVALLLTDDA